MLRVKDIILLHLVKNVLLHLKNTVRYPNPVKQSLKKLPYFLQSLKFDPKTPKFEI